jgi:serine/threonine protein phosphatase 1
MQKTWVIGDIHGCLRALKTVVAGLNVGAGDRIITLGDYVDRGPDSKGVIDWLIQRQATGTLVALMGNHEIFMLQARRDSVVQKQWMEPYVGGLNTLISYGTEERSVARLVDVPDAHWKFLTEHLHRCYETEKVIFAHASVNPKVELGAQTDEALFWSRFEPAALHLSGKPVICGHTEQFSGLPSVLSHGVCLDTGAWRAEGWLTCLNLDTGEYGQANEKGEFRKDTLPVPPATLYQGPSGANS